MYLDGINLFYGTNVAKEVGHWHVQVLFSRWLGQKKQGLSNPDDPFPWPHADKAMLDQLRQSNMQSFDASKHDFATTNDDSTRFPDAASSQVA